MALSSKTEVSCVDVGTILCQRDIMINFRLLKGSRMAMSAGLWGGSGTEEGPGWRPRFRSHESGGGDQRWNSGDRPESLWAEKGSSWDQA